MFSDKRSRAAGGGEERRELEASTDKKSPPDDAGSAPPIRVSTKDSVEESDSQNLFIRDEFGCRVPQQIRFGSEIWPHSLQVGDTKLVELPGLARLIGVPRLMVKLEGQNRTSTHKDRGAEAHAMRAKLASYEEITVGSCGNYGEAIAFAAAAKGLRCTIFLPNDTDTSAVQRHLIWCGAEIREVEGGYSDAVKASQLHARRTRKVYDGNNGGRNDGVENSTVDRDAYALIAKEIGVELQKESSEAGVILAPAGNGTLGAGIRHGFREFGLGNPRIVLCTTSNPLVDAYRCRSKECPSLIDEEVRVNHLNESVAGTVAIDGEAALQAVRSSSGSVLAFTNNSLQRAESLLEKALLKECGLRVDLLPIGAAGLASILDNPAFVRRHLGDSRHADRGIFVIIATGEVD